MGISAFVLSRKDFFFNEVLELWFWHRASLTRAASAGIPAFKRHDLKLFIVISSGAQQTANILSKIPIASAILPFEECKKDKLLGSGTAMNVYSG
jgi:hypothetical protein